MKCKWILGIVACTAANAFVPAPAWAQTPYYEGKAPVGLSH